MLNEPFAAERKKPRQLNTNVPVGCAVLMI
jgi:hypothetical protein